MIIMFLYIVTIDEELDSQQGLTLQNCVQITGSVIFISIYSSQYDVLLDGQLISASVIILI